MDETLRLYHLEDDLKWEYLLRRENKVLCERLVGSRIESTVICFSYQKQRGSIIISLGWPVPGWESQLVVEERRNLVWLRNAGFAHQGKLRQDQIVTASYLSVSVMFVNL